ncbi:MAG: diguanylate cyclase [Oscillospiraceae bacterium]
MNTNPIKLKKKHLNALAILLTGIAIILIAASYLHVVRGEEQERVNQVVQESAIQSVALINEHISNDIMYMERIAYYLGRSGLPIESRETICEFQGNIDKVKTFKSITTATPDGTLYDTDGTVLGNISDYPHFKATMSGETTVTYIEESFRDQKNIVVVSSPIVRDDKIIGVVNGRYLMSSLAEVLSTYSFGGRGYSYLANADGHIIAWDNKNTNNSNNSDIYSSFRDASALSDGDIEEMRLNMLGGKSGWISYKWFGDRRTMNYMPVGINDWYYLSVLPNEIVTSRALALTVQSFIFSGAMLAVLVLFIFSRNATRRENQRELEAVHEELLTIYNTIPGGVFKCRVDDGFTLVGANDGFYRFIGYSKDRLEARYANKLTALILPEDVENVKKTVSNQAKYGGVESVEVRFVDALDNTKWLLLCGDIMRGSDGEPLVYCCFTDITELKQTQKALHEAKHRYDLITEETQEIIFEWDPIKRTIRHSKIFEQKFGYPCTLENFPQSIVDNHLVPEEDEEACLAIYRKIEAGNHFSSGEFRIKKIDGSFIWCRVSMTAVRDANNRLTLAVGVIADIDYVKRELCAITEKSQRDPMTGLFNKTTTEQLVEHRLNTPISLAALLLLDIDNFKAVNDTLGHASGDTALIEVSHQLKQLFRATDIVGRVGGDEFMVFVEGVGRGEDLAQKLAAISKVFKWSFQKNELEYSVSCSIGVALFPRDGSTCEELSKKADAALYYAKQNGKNRFAIYSDEMQNSINGVGDVQACLPGEYGD